MAEETQLTFGDVLTNKLISIEDALPKDFNRTRFVQNALSVLNDKPDLQKTNKNKLMLGLLKGAYLNLDYSNREFYLIRYGDDVQFQYDYRGLIKICKTYSVRRVKEIYAKLIHEGDEFIEKIVDGKPSIDFFPKTLNKGEILGAFAVILYEDGGMQYEVMTKEDIDNTRKKFSKSANSKAWVDSYGEMAKKTVLRRAVKQVQLSFETIEAQKAFEAGEDSNIASREISQDVVENPFAKKEDTIDVVATEVTDAD